MWKHLPQSDIFVRDLSFNRLIIASMIQLITTYMPISQYSVIGCKTRTYTRITKNVQVTLPFSLNDKFFKYPKFKKN
jgi:hypothetical protein